MNAAHLFRLLLPSWRFFEKVGHVPRLYYRYNTSDSEQFCNWHEWVPEYKRSFKTLWLNPVGNQTLAYCSLLERFIVDLYDAEIQSDTIENSVSYRQLMRLTKTLIKQNCLESTQLFQFKIGTLLVTTTGITAQDILISKEHKYE